MQWEMQKRLLKYPRKVIGENDQQKRFEIVIY
jgi:hypothetical protein